MNSRIYKEVSFDASHRLLHYKGKCASLHGHRWRVEIWMEGQVSDKTGILIDYNLIREIVERFDHQVILNEDDPMVGCLSQFQQVITTPGDPTSELLVSVLLKMITDECMREGLSAKVTNLRVWESPGCYAELAP
ncbi:MAG: 6-carboxytetrahydropterin synthase [Methanoregulaceae archaeon]|nr:6-carboxytetrahydropterin synthase [Methanoregulaceae archaeon]